MILYTNEGNPLGLIMQLLAKLAKQPVNVVKIGLNDENILFLPALQLESGIRLLSVAGVAKYLFPNENHSRDEWLEWSRTLLIPTLSHYIGHRGDIYAKSLLIELIKKINECLKISNFLAGDKLTAADITVWCLLASDGAPVHSAPNVENLHKWYQKISVLSEVQNVLKEQSLKDFTLNAVQYSTRYGRQ